MDGSSLLKATEIAEILVAMEIIVPMLVFLFWLNAERARLSRRARKYCSIVLATVFASAMVACAAVQLYYGPVSTGVGTVVPPPRVEPVEVFLGEVFANQTVEGEGNWSISLNCNATLYLGVEAVNSSVLDSWRILVYENGALLGELNSSAPNSTIAVELGPGTHVFTSRYVVTGGNVSEPTGFELKLVADVVKE